MTADIEVSRTLYHCLCESIGTEEVVKLRRQYYASLDCFMERNDVVFISSGSKAEGLEMGSDFDAMLLLPSVIVNEEPTDDLTIPNRFCMNTEDCNPGFTQLKGQSHQNSPIIKILCVMHEGKYCIESGDVRFWFLLVAKQFTHAELHGPSVSDNRTLDVLPTFRCPEWIQQAQPWIRRARFWPPASLVSHVSSYGILLVPVGCKESPNEHLEWRISFSVAEKHLIYSFSHTQLLCYALMKLVLKEMINTKIGINELLCSYFLKNIMFWVSEECVPSIWRPENLWPCFIKCIKRLIYCIQYEFLPHYFIIENNMFAHRFNKDQQLELINCLNDLCLKGLICFTNCKTLSNFFGKTFVSKFSNSEILLCRMNTLNTLNSRAILRFAGMISLLQSLEGLHSNETKDRGRLILQRFLKIKSDSFEIFTVFTRFCQHVGKTMDIAEYKTNKRIYRLQKQYLPYFILGTNADSVCGWLYLATYFYYFCQYEAALCLISHASVNCSPNKLFQGKNLFNSINMHEVEKAEIEHHLFKDRYLYRRNAIDEISFYLGSKVFPLELGVQATFQAYITPPVYAQFLRFLCLYHLKQDSESKTAVHEMIKASKDEHFNPDNYSLAENFNCIGTAFKLVGEIQQKKSYFSKSEKLKEKYKSFYFDPNLIPSLYRLWTFLLKNDDQFV
ncbi:uncharacterized protein LOC134692481 [Mytilus trossulus]|uniref:uncharacterized protein LOC134692481 n=1 Tax=Mytilus trossulus TaxID=6551 RepID=UPI003005A9CD